MVKTAKEIFRDFNIDGVPDSGPYDPVKADIREWGTALENGGGGGGGGGGTINGLRVFTTRALAEASSVPAAEMTIGVYHSGKLLIYRRATFADPSTAALVTSGSATWGPADNVYSPLHWGASGEPVNDDRWAFVNMLKFLYGEPTGDDQMPSAYANQRPFVIDGMSKTYGVSAPVIMGNVGIAKTGMVYGLTVQNMRLRAIGDQWSLPDISPGVPRNMIVMAWHFDRDATDDTSGIYNVRLSNVTLDCQFKAGGIYVENTHLVSIENCRVDQLKKNGVGFLTSIRRKQDNPRGYTTTNGALLLRNFNVQGKVQEAGLDWPAGEDQDTMNTCGIRVYTNDARIESPIISVVTESMDIHGSALQFSNVHPWAKLIKINRYSSNTMWVNSYLDYTKFILEDSWKHKFVGCHWIIGEGLDRGVELRTSSTNTTAKDLMFTGCTFVGDMDIKYTTTGGGSWVPPEQREHQLVGCVFGSSNVSPTTAATMFASTMLGKNLIIARETGYVDIQRNDSSYGRTSIRGNNMLLGEGRTTEGQSGIYFQTKTSGAASASVERYSGANGHWSFVNSGSGNIYFGNSDGMLNAMSIAPDGTVTFNGSVNIPGGGGGGGSSFDTLQVGIPANGLGVVNVPSGNIMTVGKDRTSNGLAAIYGQSQESGGGFAIESAAGGAMAIKNGVTGAGIGISTQGKANAIWIASNGNVTFEGFVSLKSGVDAVGNYTTPAGNFESTTGYFYTRDGWFQAGTRSSIAISDSNNGVRVGSSGTIGATSASVAFNANRTTNGAIVQFARSGTIVGSITVTTSGTNYNQTSDGRLKEDFQNVDLSVIDQMKVYNFKWKTTGKRSNGVVAQELMEILPEAVTLVDIVDADNNKIGDQYQVDYTKIIPFLVEAVQDLRKRVAELEG